jgi:hypothetical protein
MASRKPLLAGVAALLLGAALPAQAKDLLDYVIEAVDPTLAPARPLIECLAGGGNAEQCALEAAKKQAGGALPIAPGDDRVQKAAKVFAAAREERWLEVLTVGGEVVAKSVSCAMLPLQGPVKSTACGIVGWVLSKNAQLIDKAYRALEGPDWWALVDVVGPGVCSLIPGDGAAGYVKELVCGALAAALLEAKKWVETFGKTVVAGADAVENLVFGDDSHMPYDRYFALYWQPWYHYSTARLVNGQGLGAAIDRVEKTCVDYFDSHNQYRSTARKTCGDLRKKFSSHVNGFAKALPELAHDYFRAYVPEIRHFVRMNFGKPTGDALPWENLFVQNCTLEMHKRLPLPDPDEARCEVLASKAGMGIAGKLHQALADSCYKEIAQQDVQPTVWAQVCGDDMRARYRQTYSGETLALLKTIGDLKKAGCALAPPEEAGALRLDCSTFAAHSICLGALQPQGRKFCYPPLQLTVTGAVLQATTPEAAATGTAARLRSLPTIFEAEALLAAGKTRLRGGQLTAQPMANFGPGWSGHAQLFWRGGAVGATLDLLVDVPRDGAWIVEIALTRAPDYGTLAFQVDEHPVAERFDGYAPRVEGPATVTLGTFAMQQGARALRLEIVGRNRASTGWLVGVDRIVLKPASGG